MGNVRTRRGDSGPNRRTFKTAGKTRFPYTIPWHELSDCEGKNCPVHIPLGERNYTASYVPVGYVRDINDREDLQLIDRDTDVAQIMSDFDIDPEEDFGAFFAKIDNGEITELYAITGSIPNLSNTLYRIAIPDVRCALSAIC